MYLGLGADHGDAGGVEVDAESDRVGGVVLLHSPARRDEHFVAGRRLADVGLGPGHDDAVRPLFDYADVKVLVLHLLGGPQSAITFDVGEAHREREVVLLQVFAVGLHVGGIGGAVLLVHSRGHDRHRVQTVLGDELGARRLSEADPSPELDHFAQAEQVFGRPLGLEGKAHAFAVFVDVGQQILITRVVVHEVVHGDPIVGDLADRVHSDVGDQLAIEVHDPAVLQALEILFCCLDGHWFPLLVDRALALYSYRSLPACQAGPRYPGPRTPVASGARNGCRSGQNRARGSWSARPAPGHPPASHPGWRCPG